MTGRKLTYIWLALIGILVYSCAQINPLQGGAKDTYAPRIDSSGTKPLSGQINFTGDEITIKFHEYIALNNPSDNIIITPQLENKPDVEAKNKKFTLRFNDELEENTTYTISFNHAITDITEKNDSIFQFVFSTGNYIDSLTVGGSVSDAFTNQPEEGFLVGLYNAETDTQYDSIPFKDQPIYIAQTNQSGRFRMNYLKGGDYFIFAVADENKNLKLDPSEKRAFSEFGKVNIGQFNEDLNLLSYKPEVSESKLTDVRFNYPGKLEFIFTNDPGDFTVLSSINLMKEETGQPDSLVYWLATNPASNMRFIANFNGDKDTLKPLYKGIPEDNEPPTLTFTNNLVRGKLLPNENLELVASEPIETIQTNGIHFMMKDSTELEQVQNEVLNQRTIAFDTLNENAALVKIDSAAILSRYGHTNKEAIWLSVKVLKKDYFGELILNIDTNYQRPVFIELLDDKNEVVDSATYSQKTVFKELIPGKYQVRLIFDDNNDRKWTPGSLKENRMPERVIYNRELIDVKSKWEKEVDWIIQN